jgi:hypothetical protein
VLGFPVPLQQGAALVNHRTQAQYVDALVEAVLEFGRR